MMQIMNEGGLIDLSKVVADDNLVKDTLTDGDKELLRLVYRDANRLYIEPTTPANFQERRGLMQSIFNRLATILGEPPDLQRGKV